MSFVRGEFFSPGRKRLSSGCVSRWLARLPWVFVKSQANFAACMCRGRPGLRGQSMGMVVAGSLASASAGDSSPSASVIVSASVCNSSAIRVRCWGVSSLMSPMQFAMVCRRPQSRSACRTRPAVSEGKCPRSRMISRP